MNVIIADDP